MSSVHPLFCTKNQKCIHGKLLPLSFLTMASKNPPIHPSGAYLHVWQKLSAPFLRGSIHSRLRLLELGKNLLTLGTGGLEVTDHVEGTWILD